MLSPVDWSQFQGQCQWLCLLIVLNKCLKGEQEEDYSSYGKDFQVIAVYWAVVTSGTAERETLGGGVEVLLR